MDLYDLIIQELEIKKSLAALIYLIERGRELEFTANGIEYFLSRDHAAKYVSLWNKHTEQSFDSIEELIENAIVEDRTFMSVWNTIKIETLF